MEQLGTIALVVRKLGMDGNPLSVMAIVTLLVGKPRMDGNPLPILRMRLDLIPSVNMDMDGWDDAIGGLTLG